ncbi:MAG: acetyltransferase [Rubrivivax sp.]|nr:acetyltransferase [Rubrivivax sp.]
MSPSVIVVGAGGHGVVVADALLAAGVPVLGFTDDDSHRHGQRVLGLPVLGGDEALAAPDAPGLQLANGIGGTGLARTARRGLRAELQRRLEAIGFRFCTVVHPAAIVSRHAEVGASAQLLAGSVVQPRARIGAGAIVNTRAIVEHDVMLGEFVHVAPGAVLCGGVSVGEQAHVGVGAVVRQGLRIGPGTMIGAGAAVVCDCDGGVWAGVPARQIGGAA